MRTVYLKKDCKAGKAIATLVAVAFLLFTNGVGTVWALDRTDGGPLGPGVEGDPNIYQDGGNGVWMSTLSEPLMPAETPGMGEHNEGIVDQKNDLLENEGPVEPVVFESAPDIGAVSAPTPDDVVFVKDEDGKIISIISTYNDENKVLATFEYDADGNLTGVESATYQHVGIASEGPYYVQRDCIWVDPEKGKIYVEFGAIVLIFDLNGEFIGRDFIEGQGPAQPTGEPPAIDSGDKNLPTESRTIQHVDGRFYYFDLTNGYRLDITDYLEDGQKKEIARLLAEDWIVCGNFDDSGAFVYDSNPTQKRKGEIDIDGDGIPDIAFIIQGNDNNNADQSLSGYFPPYDSGGMRVDQNCSLVQKEPVEPEGGWLLYDGEPPTGVEPPQDTEKNLGVTSLSSGMMPEGVEDPGPLPILEIDLDDDRIADIVAYQIPSNPEGESMLLYPPDPDSDTPGAEPVEGLIHPSELDSDMWFKLLSETNGGSDAPRYSPAPNSQEEGIELYNKLVSEGKIYEAMILFLEMRRLFSKGKIQYEGTNAIIEAPKPSAPVMIPSVEDPHPAPGLPEPIIIGFNNNGDDGLRYGREVVTYMGRALLDDNEPIYTPAKESFEEFKERREEWLQDWMEEKGYVYKQRVDTAEVPKLITVKEREEFLPLGSGTMLRATVKTSVTIAATVATAAPKPPVYKTPLPAYMLTLYIEEYGSIGSRDWIDYLYDDWNNDEEE